MISNNKINIMLRQLNKMGKLSDGDDFGCRNMHCWECPLAKEEGGDCDSIRLDKAMNRMKERLENAKKVLIKR